MRFYLLLAAVIIGFAVIAIANSGKTSWQAYKPSPANTFSTLVGKPAPDFTLSSLAGQSYTLSSLRGKNVVLFFSEGIMCYPACWNQIAALGTDQSLNNADTVSLNIVPDTKSEWASTTYSMPDLAKGTILFDEYNKVANAYGTLNLESSMHKGSKPGHTYIVIDKNGIIRYTYDDPTMNLQEDKLKQEIAKL